MTSAIGYFFNHNPHLSIVPILFKHHILDCHPTIPLSPSSHFEHSCKATIQSRYNNSNLPHLPYQLVTQVVWTAVYSNLSNWQVVLTTVSGKMNPSARFDSSDSRSKSHLKIPPKNFRYVPDQVLYNGPLPSLGYEKPTRESFLLDTVVVRTGEAANIFPFASLGETLCRLTISDRRALSHRFPRARLQLLGRAYPLFPLLEKRNVRMWRQSVQPRQTALRIFRTAPDPTGRSGVKGSASLWNGAVRGQNADAEQSAQSPADLLP